LGVGVWPLFLARPVAITPATTPLATAAAMLEPLSDM
jgi:hypothetical protein